MCVCSLLYAPDYRCFSCVCVTLGARGGLVVRGSDLYANGAGSNPGLVTVRTGPLASLLTLLFVLCLSLHMPMLQLLFAVTKMRDHGIDVETLGRRSLVCLICSAYNSYIRSLNSLIIVTIHTRSQTSLS